MPSPLLRSLTIFAAAARILLDALWLDMASRFRSKEQARAAAQRAYRRWAVIIRRTVLRLQGVTIKVGQFLSARADVLPEVFLKELSGLQDAVPPAPFPSIRRQVEQELGAPLTSVFAWFEEEPVASASLGQVHRALLKEEQVVAVKVLRPGIERLVAADIAALRRVVWFVDRFTRWGRTVDLWGIADEFETVTYQEMDYRQESANMHRFRRQFAGQPQIKVPVPHDHLVTRRVLVMEYVEGIKLTEHDRMAAAGIDVRALAARLIDAYIKQTMIDGFVHVDPHPGNLMVRPDGTLIFVDFGMMGWVGPEDRRNFATLLISLLMRDLDAAVEAIRALELLRPGASTDVLKQALEILIRHFSGARVRSLDEVEQFLEDFRTWVYEEPLQFPVRYLYIGRTAALLAGMCSTLDPSIDWVTTLRDKALPLLRHAEAGEAGKERPRWLEWVEELFGEGTAQVADAAWKQAAAAGISLVRVPPQLERVLGKMDAGSLQVTADVSELRPLLERQAAMTGRLVWAVLAAAGGVAGAILRSGGYPAEARWAWGAGGLALLGVLLSLLGRRGRRR